MIEFLLVFRKERRERKRKQAPRVCMQNWTFVCVCGWCDVTSFTCQSTLSISMRFEIPVIVRGREVRVAHSYTPNKSTRVNDK